ncbi:TPA: MazG-like family protein [Streptococcus suis]
MYLIKNVLQWSVDRNLHTADPEGQLLKLFEEFGELNSGIVKQDLEVIKDSVGDVLVVLTILLQQTGCDAEETFEKANQLAVHHPKTLPIKRLAVLAGYQIGRLVKDALWSREKDNIPKVTREIILKMDFIARYYDLSMQECYLKAWNEIKDRKGKMIDGVWVKEEDLKDDK